MEEFSQKQIIKRLNENLELFIKNYALFTKEQKEEFKRKEIREPLELLKLYKVKPANIYPI